MSSERFLIGSCERCGQHIEFPENGVGMRIPCPHCGGDTVLVEDRAVATPSSTEITAAELTGAFAGVAPRRRVSIFYQAGLLLVAVFMVLLPLAYLAFATFSAYCIYWYAMHARVLFSSFSGGVHLNILRVIAYVGPLLGGGVAVFFMFKPLLARRPKHAEPIELNPAQHPRLYQFIAQISDLLGVSMPKRTYLDCSLNAGAALRRGWLSFFGRDLVLILGLPLVAGLNTRQLAAVVAHELGHCTQGLAMRLGFVIDRIDRWFFRVIYERDTWDESFDEWANSVEDWRMGLVVGCARLAVWLSRKVLTMLMLIGHAASCFLSRQMEFHADACAMAVAGSEGVETLLIRLRELALLEHMAYASLEQIWQKRHLLPDSVPDFLDRLERRLPADFHEHARTTLLNESAGLFATHPTAAQRIQKARQRAEPGTFNLEKPARELFNDFTATSQQVTGRHYRLTLHLAVTPPMLKPVSEFIKDEEHEVAAR